MMVHIFLPGDAGSQYFLHLRDWYKHRNEPHMLNIQFEDMVKVRLGNDTLTNPWTRL